MKHVDLGNLSEDNGIRIKRKKTHTRTDEETRTIARKFVLQKGTRVRKFV